MPVCAEERQRMEINLCWTWGGERLVRQAGMGGGSMGEKSRKNGFIKLLMIFCMFTSSCDIFLVLTVGGSTVRWGQIAMMALAAMAFFDVVKERKVKMPCGCGFLLGFVLVNTLFLYNCPSLRNGIGYNLWLILDVAMIYVAAHFTDKAFSLDELLKWYILSFVCVAVFGILQKLLQFGHIYILVTQKAGSTVSALSLLIMRLICWQAGRFWLICWKKETNICSRKGGQASISQSAV